MRSARYVLLAALFAVGCEGQAKRPALQDTQNDPQHCGNPPVVCPTPAHASAVCLAGVCTRSDCEPGWLDLQADVIGCETAQGGVPATGLVAATPSSSTSLLQHAQTSARHRNEAVLGEPTPAVTGGAVEQTDGTYRNQPGFIAAFE
jgi:hypothetical protein